MVIHESIAKETYPLRYVVWWCVRIMMKLKVRIETDEWIYEENEVQ